MLTARPLSIWDAAFCWRLAHDDGVRLASLNPDKPSVFAHLLWMASWIGDCTRQAWVIHRLCFYSNRTQVRECAGLVRVDVDGTVSIAVAQGHRGRGVALFGVNVATYFAQMHGWGTPTAHIRATNGASIGLFAKAGYEMAGARDGIVTMKKRAA